jgi:hypothetical protein
MDPDPYGERYESNSDDEDCICENGDDDELLRDDRGMTIRMCRLFDEKRTCQFGPVWKQTYRVLIDVLNTSIPSNKLDKIIQKILSFHAAIPPSPNPTHYLRIWTPKNRVAIEHLIENPQCFSCLDFPKIGSKMYATVSYNKFSIDFNTVKFRFICATCMSPLLFKYIADFNWNINFKEEKKFGPELIPQNESAAAALIGMEEGDKICSNYGVVCLPNSIPCTPSVIVKMNDIVLMFRISYPF